MADQSILIFAVLPASPMPLFCPQETPYSPSLWSKAKRSCYRRLPDKLKPTPAPALGFQLSQFTIFQAIGVPLINVAADVVTDGKLVFNMLYYIETLLAIDTGDNTYDNVTKLHNSTTSTERANQRGANILWTQVVSSGFLLIFSMLNLIFGNPAKTLIQCVTVPKMFNDTDIFSST